MWGKNSAHVTFHAYILLGNQLQLSLHMMKWISLIGMTFMKRVVIMINEENGDDAIQEIVDQA